MQVLYTWLAASMLVVLFIVYPTAAGRLPIVPAFSEWCDAAHEPPPLPLLIGAPCGALAHAQV